ncbi:MAG: glutamate synthase-related protein [Atribacterota bacterium]|nr:glutamate synthase-related protein [Atribacterota bacterium]MDD5636798.1 glutamate synthase-related protein [Atribacterota bacterium]
MSFSIYNASTVNKTKRRTPKDFSPFSGICTVCTNDCLGTCEIGRSAVRGSEILYPTERTTSQTASEKDYPVDFSHFNINGRCFGSFGTEPGKTAYPNVNLNIAIGNEKNKLKLKSPFVLPAMAKLNWKGYFSGAAISGLIAVIGEDMPTTDPDTVLKHGKIVHLPMLKEMYDSFYQFNEGYGALFLQANSDDEKLGLLDYALQEVGFEAVELKLGQAAKGIQGMGKLPSLEKALQFQQMGYEVYPDPNDPTVQELYRNNMGPTLYKVGRLPEWEEETFLKRVKNLRDKGAKYISIKTGPFRPADLAKTIMLASKAGIDFMTVDGAGGGTGNSPIHMMNEWGYPTVYLETILFKICQKMQERNLRLPTLVMAGGFSFEDHIFKGLALGSPYVRLIGIGRAAMTAAMVGQTLGKLIQKGNIPTDLTQYGQSLSEIFCGFPDLKARFGDKVEDIPLGAFGVYNYMERINTGLQQLMALCRKYQLPCISRDDLIPLTEGAARVTGLTKIIDTDLEEIDKIVEK